MVIRKSFASSLAGQSPRLCLKTFHGMWPVLLGSLHETHAQNSDNSVRNASQKSPSLGTPVSLQSGVIWKALFAFLSPSQLEPGGAPPIKRLRLPRFEPTPNTLQRSTEPLSVRPLRYDAKFSVIARCYGQIERELIILQNAVRSGRDRLDIKGRDGCKVENV